MSSNVHQIEAAGSQFVPTMATPPPSCWRDHAQIGAERGLGNNPSIARQGSMPHSLQVPRKVNRPNIPIESP